MTRWCFLLGELFRNNFSFLEKATYVRMMPSPDRIEVCYGGDGVSFELDRPELRAPILAHKGQTVLIPWED